MTKINRRQFIKVAGAGAIVTGTAVACGKKAANALVAGSENDGEMPYRECGGDRVSLIGYGCMRWQMTKDAYGNDIIDQNSVDELVEYAYNHGINYFDSAPVYLQGQSEAATAKALSRYPRESYYVATKCSNMRGNTTYEEGVQMYKTSLANYNTDYIDYYLLHNIGNYSAFKSRFEDSGLIDYFLKERELGHIRKLGFSFHGNREGFDELMAVHDKYHFDFVQIQMNYVDWTHAEVDSNMATNAEYMYNELDKRSTPITIMEPLLGGSLSSVPESVAREMKTREPSRSVASWAFRFAGSHPRVLCVLSGMTYMEHLQDNLKTFLNFKPLNQSEFDFLESMAGIIKSYPLIGCTGCSYCMPCPFGINIPEIFKHYNMQVNAGNIAESVEQKNFKKLKKAYLTSYDKAIETVRQADHCIGCNSCVPRCPQRIQIPSQLRRIDQYIEKLKREEF